MVPPAKRRRRSPEKDCIRCSMRTASRSCQQLPYIHRVCLWILHLLTHNWIRHKAPHARIYDGMIPKGWRRVARLSWQGDMVKPNYPPIWAPSALSAEDMGTLSVTKSEFASDAEDKSYVSLFLVSYMMLFHMSTIDGVYILSFLCVDLALCSGEATG